MFETKIELAKNTLFIETKGAINKRNIKKLKRKLYYIANEYNIGDIVLNLKNCSTIDQEALYNFLDEYDDIYGGKISIMDD